MRALISGSRTFTDYEKFKTVMENEGVTVIVHGKNPRGADALAKKYAEEKGLPCFECPANWDYYKKAAGPIRNRWMLDHFPVDIVIAFPTEESVGTRDMIKYAEKKEVHFVVYES